MMTREGLEIDSQTLWDQVYALSRHVEPTYDALMERALSAPVVHADESDGRSLGRKPSLEAACGLSRRRRWSSIG